jgi:hypothetical protein
MDPEQAMVTTSVVPEAARDGDRPGIAHRSASAALGAAGLAWDLIRPSGGPGQWPDLAVGAAYEARQTAAELLADLQRAGARRRARMTALAERGARERARGRRRAGAAVDSAVMAVATSPIVDRVVDAQLDRVLRPVVLAVLDEVLVLLEKEPERIQVLIRGQRDSMVDELVGRIRTGAVTGDSAVDRLTARMFHRGRSPSPAVDL